MITKITIDRVFFSSQPKAGGLPYTDKFSGKPKKLVTLYSSQLPKDVKSVSCFAVEGSPLWDWKEKQEVVIEITKNGEWHNFKPASEGMLQLMKLEERVAKLEDQMLGVTREQREVRGVGISVKPKKQLTEDEEIERLNKEMNGLPPL